MTSTRQRATALVAEAFATEQDDCTMDDLLGDLDMSDFELDPRIRNERDSDRINYYGSLDAQRRGVINLGAEGLPEAMTVDFDEPLRMLTRTQVDLQRNIGSENLLVIDLHQEFATKVDAVPPWDIHDPKTANVQRGLVAGQPEHLYVIRGRFSSHDLLGMIWSQYRITTQCGMRISMDCDIRATPSSASAHEFPRQKVWGIFTVPHGDWLVYITTCVNCYFSFWHQDGDNTVFDSFDPKKDQKWIGPILET